MGGLLVLVEQPVRIRVMQDVGSSEQVWPCYSVPTFFNVLAVSCGYCRF